jgi:bifunctional non-homologous end joining protein LigD
VYPFRSASRIETQANTIGFPVFRHACKMGFEGIVSKRLGPPYVSGRSRDWLKFKKLDAPVVKREFEEDLGKTRRR